MNHPHELAIVEKAGHISAILHILKPLKLQKKNISLLSECFIELQDPSIIKN